ncbi:hypothetical protein V2W30_33575 [Streptomyces sp. Q6]|uniref:Uncharacterized protein n=1 Tax=Streptomyces citrinus TaxID=3118173 RepID=A0ACD5AKK1_9ACTN
MSLKRRPALAGLTMVLVVALAACGGTTDSGSSTGGTATADSGYAQDTSREKDVTITGVRDSLRHVTRKTRRATRPHFVKKCGTETRRVRHTKRVNGRTRTWYTTKTYRDCEKVRKGTEAYTRVVRKERWCVRLDDVNGKPRKDDVWYRVGPATYSEVNGADERAKVTFEPVAQGC